MSTTKVSADLHAIIDMADRLEARAIDAATRGDRLGSAPLGGEAMVNLAPIGDLGVWIRRNDLAGDALEIYEDPDELWSPFQMLRFWSEDWRQQLGMDHDDPTWRPSLRSEAAFLRNADVMAWAWDNEIHWDDYASDVATARRKLEDVLTEGERAERGVPCMYDECRGARIIRKLEPARDEHGRKIWRWSLWHCPRCHRKWTEDGYAAMVTAAKEAAKIADINGQTWCSVDYAARKIDRSSGTIRSWMSRNELATACMIAGRRLPFISLDEVRELAEARPRRNAHRETAR